MTTIFQVQKQLITDFVLQLYLCSTHKSSFIGDDDQYFQTLFYIIAQYLPISS